MVLLSVSANRIVFEFIHMFADWTITRELDINRNLDLDLNLAHVKRNINSNNFKKILSLLLQSYWIVKIINARESCQENF